MKLYSIKISGPLRFRYMRVSAPDENTAKIRASRMICPRKGEYIQEVREVL